MATPPIVLEIQTGKYKGRKVKVTYPQMIVGRGEDAGIRISSAEVSREHCALIPRDDGVLVRDMESRNGTFVDGRPIMGEKLLTPGSTLTIGPMTFLLLGESPPVGVTPPDRIAGVQGADDQDLSDDDIANWLSDELPASVSTSDTTIIKDDSSESMPARPTPTRPVAAPPPRRREFKSLEEEARDIIRRHFEALAGDQSDGAG